MKRQSKKLSSAEGIKEMLMAQQLTLAVAESVTCGHLQTAFAAIPDTGKFFQGGITAYNLGQKVYHLKVEPINAELYNCVSEAVARQMAMEVARRFFADVGISITGYASPMPEKGIYDIYAYFAVSKKGKLLAVKKISSEKTTPSAVQKDYCEQVLAQTLQLLKTKSKV